MAQDNIYFDQTTRYGSMLRQALNQLENGFEGLNDVLATMGHMVTGDGTDATQFDEVTSRFGFDDNTDAKAAYDELNSLLAKLNADGNVTFVNAAMLQAFAKMR